jgi:hypothetical protein
MPEHDLHPFLCLLADSLVTSLADGGDSALVHVIARPEGPEVGILPLDGAEPAEYLLGAVAPAEWSALGVATRGRAGPLSGGGAPSAAEVVVLVPRAGPVVGRMRHRGEVVTEPPAYGLAVDCLQRALGLPTAPPQVPAVHLAATAWLEAVLRTAGVAEALELLEPGLEWGALRWERLRQLAAQGRWPHPTVSPEDAAWFDEGSFSRWVLADRLPLPALLSEVAATIGPAEARRCAGVLAGMGIDAGPAPPNRHDRRRRRSGGSGVGSRR